MSIGILKELISFEELTPDVNNKPIEIKQHGFHCQVLMGVIRMATTSAPGTRLLSVSVENSEGSRVFQMYARVQQSPDTTIDYTINTGAPYANLGILPTPDTDNCHTLSLPSDFVVLDGQTLRVYDVRNIDPLDTIEVSGTAAIIRG